ncbi:LtrC [Liquorilactobacillus ghanensis DSM 18630]|uniref:LtrC n=1 Tax=Liquorilactobacillus ghanensis DSM 18630 TaxID=1423750 RepID=A0A0R1VUN1_9LACO|nr:ArdC-like ssDNA-binding domain-containing protein [Liquorilactobacillus ghanensis]KRM07547.1 LtrC [Liquorilactobacillus ghanensis DSM 18630]
MRPTKAEAEAWRKKLVDDAEQKILDLTDSDKFKGYLDTLAKFHQYSSRNVSLIYSQDPTASEVAGYKKWKTDFNRQVKKGAKSIRIAAPIIKKLTPEDQKRLNTTDERGIVGYRYIPVFDIKQTTGEHLINVKDFVKEHLAEHKNVTALFDEFKEYLNKNTNLKVSEKPLAELGGAKGYFQPSTNEIVIGEDEPDTALKLKTLYHEYAHSQLHGLTSEFKDRPREYQETQAEAVAYVAMQNIGVDTSDYSLGYVATWAKDKDLIHSALSEIQNVSNKSIEITDILTNKLGLQEELQNVAKISTEKLNSQYISLDTGLKKLESQQKISLAKLDQAKKTNNQKLVENIKQEVKDNQQSKNKLSNSLTVVKEEITKRTQKSLNEFAKQHQEVKQPEKDQQHQLKI